MDLTSHDGTKILVMGLCGPLEIAITGKTSKTGTWAEMVRQDGGTASKTLGIKSSLQRFRLKFPSSLCSSIAEAARMRLARCERPDAGARGGSIDVCCIATIFCQFHMFISFYAPATVVSDQLECQVARSLELWPLFRPWKGFCENAGDRDEIC